MNTLTLQATFCGLLHGLGKLAFRADKTAADLLAALPDTPEWAVVRGGAAAGSDAARCAAFARSLSVTADTPAAEPASTRCPAPALHFQPPERGAPRVFRPGCPPGRCPARPRAGCAGHPRRRLPGALSGADGAAHRPAVQPGAGKRAAGPAGIPVQCPACQHRAGRGPGHFPLRPAQADVGLCRPASASTCSRPTPFPCWTLPQSCAGNRRSCSTPPTFPASSGSSTPSIPRVPCGPSAAVRSFWNCSWSTTWTSCWTAAA